MAVRLVKGDKVADFALPDQTGTTRKLSEFLAEGPVVLFFYPAAMTRGCTMESCHFRDLATEFAEVGAQRVGISRDPVDKQRKFAEMNDFDYPLLSDREGAIAEQFGIKRSIPLGPLSIKRKTFVIDVDHTIMDVFHSEINMNGHADQALEVLRRRAG
ncbi:peroxiredoxin [Stackebrandtia nassauensis]|uniref:thioredoxin-dependent peroxiredoxin n=1 Tax=Stackebrandtia nassauensis (strain DSM 44728 / CIP 108903 / NRRL B-16338 / NBRC 102104 / LLR-40K-21) TaxID=446470 RepID=D3Q9N7_STANL|nr:peroxiredoxin [Stackebrandtia nassauensis]ADD44583.1 alkyl hydroperoxide reductase/ Thiol specific antioxidant/ Mal allergen [Stackebrandtia nassauensis DSM 44728]